MRRRLCARPAVRHLVRSVLLSLATVVAACEDRDGSTEPIGSGVLISEVIVTPRVDTIFVRDSLAVTDRLQLQATVLGFGGSPIPAAPVRWRTADTAVVRVDSLTGLVVPRRVGTAAVAAMAGGKEGFATVVVEYAARRLVISSPVLSITGVAPSVDSIFLGDSVRVADARVLRPIAIDVNGDTIRGVRYTWSSSDTQVATVDSTGRVRPVAFGTTTITVRGADLTASRQVTVLSAVRSLTLTPGNDSIFVLDPIRPSDTQRFTATPVLWASAPRDVPVKTRWSASQPTVVRVDSTGLVTAIGLGPATVTASAGTSSAFAAVTVLSAVRELRITPPPTRVLVDDTLRLSARAIGYQGDTLNIPLVWRSTTPAATVLDSARGIVRFNNAGPAGFTVTGAFVTARTGAADVQVLDRVFLSADAGEDFTCSVIQLGRVYCWGRNAEGQLGAPSDSVCFDTGSSVSRCSLLPERTTTTQSFARVVAGDATSCGVATSGRAYCWGVGTLGRLGNGTNTSSATPTLVTSALAFDSTMAGFSVGDRHVCGIAAGARIVYCWGDDTSGQLGTQAVTVNSTTPIPADLASTPDGPVQAQWVSAGYRHTCAVALNGQAYCWGANTSGELGTGARSGAIETPVAVGQGVVFRSISASSIAQVPTGREPVGDDFQAHTCRLRSDGRALCWGANLSGQTGTSPSTPYVTTPAPVDAPVAFTQISAGGAFTCALGTDRAIYCWGRNDVGQLGQGAVGGPYGAPLPIATPLMLDQDGRIVPVGGPVAFVSVSAGRRHACGLAVDGQLYCWGSDVLGALGSQLQARVQPRPMRVAKPL